MITSNWVKYLFLILLTTLTACGDGSSTATKTLSMQESQSYFPLNDGNLWTSHETYSVNGTVTTSFDRVSQRAGTKLIGGLYASVISEHEIPTNFIYESYLVKDSSGITIYGNNKISFPSTSTYSPYNLISFPIQIGVSIHQLDKKEIDYGFDFDTDGINEKVDITIDVVASGFETISTPAGVFQNCLRVDTTEMETLTLSSTGSKISAVSKETTWYARNIGQVKQITNTFGNGFANQITEEITGYMVGLMGVPAS